MTIEGRRLRVEVEAEEKVEEIFFAKFMLQGHPPELSDSVKLLLSDAKRYGFEIDQVLKSID